MCRKSPSLAYFYKKIRTTRKSELFDWLDDSPLTTREYAFISDVIEGLSLTELSDKYHKTPSRCSHWKREVCEKIHEYDVANLRPNFKR